jgi:arylsulfate sulfotransferase
LQRIRRRFLILIGSLVTACSISGCNSSGFAPVPTILPNSAILLPGQSFQFSATVPGGSLVTPGLVASAVWSVNQVAGGSDATGTITSSGLYTAPTGTNLTPVQISVRDSADNRVSTPILVSFIQPNQFPPGTVSGSANPLVAQYLIATPAGTTVQVQFGTTTNYGLDTSEQPAPAAGGVVKVLVAGMRASTSYHMRAVIHLPSGDTAFDADQVFTTGAIPASILPNLAVQQTPGLAPASGVEMLNLFEGAPTQLTSVVTDLEGNVIWYYAIQPLEPFPMKLLPNGHMLVVFSGVSIQEIDLAGNVIFQITQDQLQKGLLAAGLPIQANTVPNANHDIFKLDNGHLIFIVSFNQVFDGNTMVTGNAVVDWDPVSGAPAWMWSTFDHLSLTHAPFGTADWTHANAVIYSPDDGNLILSMRNQNWIVKINYQDGAGDGKILWRFGPEGDFTLPSGQAPIEWNYGQHYPVLLGPNTSGIYPLMFFNNGNNRLVDSANDVCGTPGFTACYSSVPTFQLNEYTNTAEVTEETNLAPAFSFCCGDAERLGNGNLEYDIAASGAVVNVSTIQEVTRGQSPPQLVWQMSITGQLAYRGFRMPSLYPGIEWTQSAIATANAKVVSSAARKAAKE